MADWIKTASLQSATADNRAAGADFPTAAADTAIRARLDPYRTSSPRSCGPDSPQGRLGITPDLPVILGEDARRFRPGSVVAAGADINDHRCAARDRRPGRLLVLYGQAMNLEAVWRADPFNGLPLGAYVVRVCKFAPDFADNWYVAWLNDEFHTLSLPQYLNQLDAHTSASLERWYDVWRSDTANTLSYPDYLTSLLHHGETFAETKHPQWASSSATTSFPDYLHTLSEPGRD